MRTAVKRALLVFFVLALAGLAILARLFQLQIFEHKDWLAMAQAIQEDRIEIPARRGTIYDRNGVPLAYDVPAYSIAVDNYHLTNPELLVDLLVKELRMSPEEAKAKVYRPSYFTWLVRNVDLDKAQRLKALAQAQRIKGLLFFPTWKRAYSQGSSAIEVLGLVGVDGDGLSGLELAFDGVLRGKPRVIRVLRAADGTPYDLWEEDPGSPGHDLHLTLDSRIQWICEAELDETLRTTPADRGCAVVLDPKTGEVLALAQSPRYDPQNPRIELLKPWAITDVFEPGSTFKGLVALAAWDLGLVSEGEYFEATSPRIVAGVAIKNARNQSYPPLTLRDALAQSVNTVLVQVAQRVGVAKLYEYLRRMGFGEPTGIELPGEAAGLLRPPEKWTEVDLAVSSFGQSVGVTAIQLATAYAALCNDGALVRPHLLPGPAEARGSVAKPSSCQKIREFLGYAVNTGTGSPAKVPGFKVGGKSGTAQIALPGQGYVPGHITTAMAAFFPWDSPEYTIVVVYQTSKTEDFWSGTTAVPSAGRIVRAMAAMGLAYPPEITTLGRSG
ncbi:MAG: peptidoglycan D,D-transpeptidase FtsI family protein [Candidatus Bipolaricaulaceae bacterium]